MNDTIRPDATKRLNILMIINVCVWAVLMTIGLWCMKSTEPGLGRSVELVGLIFITLISIASLTTLRENLTDVRNGRTPRSLNDHR